MGACVFICGDDDYLVAQRGKEVFEAAAQTCEDEFSREVIDGGAQSADEVSTVISRTLQATQTLSLFGGKKAVWLRGLNVLSDSRTGRTEDTKTQLEALQNGITGLDPETVSLVITAYPVDRRRKEFKWFQKHADFTDIKIDAGNLTPLIERLCGELGVGIEPPAMQALVNQAGGNTRLIVEEVRKLATYLADESKPLITEAEVLRLVPAFGEGDFFEVTEAFFSLDLPWTLDALKRHFFIHDESRPLLASLQNRTRLLIQLRALMDAGAFNIGRSGIPKHDFEAAAARYGGYYGDEADKSSFNLFTQNLWYLGNKVGLAAEKLTLRQLLRIEEALVGAFEAILERPNEQYAVMNALAVSCLG